MKKMLQPVNLEEMIAEIEAKGFHRWLVDALTQAYAEARKGKRKTRDMHKFELNWGENILNLAKTIEEKIFVPGSSLTFVVFDPMVREIFAAPARDRSIHHLLHRMQGGWWDKKFIPTSTSCRAGKGTLEAIYMAQDQMIEVTKNCTKKARVVKLDIRGYFMSLSRKLLFWRLLKGLDEQFAPYWDRKEARQLYLLCKFLWRQVIMDDPVGKARKRGAEANWDPKVLPPKKSLFCQPEGQGIVIGNLTSQLASNIFLDRLDKFITETLGYQFYGRYVDDFYIMVAEEDYPQLKRDIKLIESFLKDELGLTLHPTKRYMQSVYKGMPFLGARIYPKCLYPSDRTQAKFRQTMEAFDRGEASIDSVISYLGHMRHLDADRFVEKVFRESGWDFEVYLESKKKIKRPMRDLVMEMSRKA